MTALEPMLERLLGRGHRGMALGLERTRAALAAVGNPELGLRAFHIAGSNGKGSVSAMIDAALGEAGIRRGLYTSPHLERYNERIAIDGAPISDAPFAEALARTFADAPETLTFFETLTVAAFLAFRDAGVEVAVLEVGLGGRLDATNVIDDPLAAAVVTISSGDNGRHLEHADFLGETVEALTREKAGVFKRGAPAVMGPLDPTAAAVARDIATGVGAMPIVEIEPGRAELRGSSPHFTLGDSAIALHPALPGAHQIENAAVAAAAMLLARPRLPSLLTTHIESGIAAARWPGRLEMLRLGRGRPAVLLDAAHNVDGARALAAALPALGIDPAHTTLVFGALADKAYAAFLDKIAPLTRARFYTCPGGRAPAPLDALTRIAPGACIADPREAIDAAIRAAGENDTVLVTGSIYLVGTVRAHLLGARRDPAVGL